MATVQRKIVHKQFNSPIALYSDVNVQETLDRELRQLGNGAIGWVAIFYVLCGYNTFWRLPSAVVSFDVQWSKRLPWNDVTFVLSIEWESFFFSDCEVLCLRQQFRELKCNFYFIYCCSASFQFNCIFTLNWEICI